ncbi:UDP-Glycosyltransferase superfamily protein [Striga asiatica]|uniref:Glycosyltransferase n=1 Tax=Striga asiatica TaxID=4170 RepID=A0A5A7P577_STRAF|nr:UDP-Glycosyltransferase superfamily protein [Striga asiatica]
MDDDKGKNKAHCLIIPYPTQGHVNPMLQFANRLTHKGIRVTIALTKFLLTKSTNGPSFGPISAREISDGFDSGGRAEAKSSEEYQARFECVGRETLTGLLLDLAGTGRPVDCVVYDSFIPWAVDVAKGLGLFGAAFFTQSCTVDAIYYLVYKGELKLPVDGEAVVAAAPGLPEMRSEDLPSFVYDYGSYPGTFRLLLNQFRGLEKAEWIFINTFDQLEKEVLEWMSRFWRGKAIGPTIPSTYLDKQLDNDKHHNLNILGPPSITSIDWLNRQHPKSVVYVSFGSLAELTPQQTEELAWALAACGKHFLWVVRSSEQPMLPPNFTHDDVSGKGLVVPWAPQVEVLAHPATGCFVTHCGWNSTLEGLCSGVPMVAMPQWTDQSTNAKLVTDVWALGMRARKDEFGIVKKGEIVSCVRRVMEGDEGRVIRSNAGRWREVAREAMGRGGSSDRNIDEFAKGLMNLHA